MKNNLFVRIVKTFLWLIALAFSGTLAYYVAGRIVDVWKNDSELITSE